MTSDLGKIKILNREKSRSWTRKNQGQEKMATEDDIVGWYHWLNEHVSESHSAVSKSLQTHGLYSHWNSPGQNTEVSSLSLLQGIFPTQGLKPGLPHCRWILYQLSHQGSPRTLEWVTYPFSSGSSQPRNPYGVSCIAGRFFTNWATGRQEFEHILGDSEGQGSLACCSHEVSKNWTQLSGFHFHFSLISQLVKNPPAMQEIPVRFLGGEVLLEKW